MLFAFDLFFDADENEFCEQRVYKQDGYVSTFHVGSCFETHRESRDDLIEDRCNLGFASPQRYRFVAYSIDILMTGRSLPVTTVLSLYQDMKMGCFLIVEKLDGSWVRTTCLGSDADLDSWMKRLPWVAAKDDYVEYCKIAKAKAVAHQDVDQPKPNTAAIMQSRFDARNR